MSPPFPVVEPSNIGKYSVNLRHCLFDNLCFKPVAVISQERCSIAPWAQIPSVLFQMLSWTRLGWVDAQRCWTTNCSQKHSGTCGKFPSWFMNMDHGFQAHISAPVGHYQLDVWRVEHSAAPLVPHVRSPNLRGNIFVGMGQNHIFSIDFCHIWRDEPDEHPSYPSDFGVHHGSMMRWWSSSSWIWMCRALVRSLPRLITTLGLEDRAGAGRSGLAKARKMPWKAEDDFGQFREFRVSIILPSHIIWSYLVLFCACDSFCLHPLNPVRFASAPASRSALPPGDYYFAWARDGALSMNAYLQTKPFPQSDEKMEKWIQSLEKAQHESDPNGINVPWPMRRMMGWPKRASRMGQFQGFVCCAVISENVKCPLTLVLWWEWCLMMGMMEAIPTDEDVPWYRPNFRHPRCWLSLSSWSPRARLSRAPGVVHKTTLPGFGPSPPCPTRPRNPAWTKGFGASWSRTWMPGSTWMHLVTGIPEDSTFLRKIGG